MQLTSPLPPATATGCLRISSDRPIALVTTVNRTGRITLPRYSFSTSSRNRRFWCWGRVKAGAGKGHRRQYPAHESLPFTWWIGRCRRPCWWQGWLPSGVDELALAGWRRALPPWSRRHYGGILCVRCRTERLLDWPNRVLVIGEVVRCMSAAIVWTRRASM